MRTLRKLVLGETWYLPLGIAVVLGLGAVASACAPSSWHNVGGPALLAGVLLVLVAAVRRS